MISAITASFWDNFSCKWALLRFNFLIWLLLRSPSGRAKAAAPFSKNCLVQKWLFWGNSSCRKGLPLWNNGDGLDV